jgi:photosystem II stability/assembly factor-like uncharacterized protein
VLVIDSQTPTTLYGLASGDLYKSTDGSGSWSATGLTPAGGVSALAIDPQTPTTLYAGSGNGGVYKSTDGGSTWNVFNAGLTNTQIIVVAIDPLDPRKVYAGTNGGGVFVIEQTQGGGDTDGCTVTPDAGSGAVWCLLVPALVLAWARRRASATAMAVA